MTIAAGFRCQDGVVLCADTQMSTGISKFSQSKFRMYTKLQCKPALVYAGDREFSLMAIQLIAQAILKAESEKAPVVDAIRTEAIEIYKRYHEMSTVERVMELQAVATIRVDGKRKLFLINGPTVSPVERAECIGVGSYLGYYVIDTMFQKAAKAWEVAHAAAYLLFLTKSYVAYCGNESQIMIFGIGVVLRLSPTTQCGLSH